MPQCFSRPHDFQAPLLGQLVSEDRLRPARYSAAQAVCCYETASVALPPLSQPYNAHPHYPCAAPTAPIRTLTQRVAVGGPRARHPQLWASCRKCHSAAERLCRTPPNGAKTTPPCRPRVTVRCGRIWPLAAFAAANASRVRPGCARLCAARSALQASSPLIGAATTRIAYDHSEPRSTNARAAMGPLLRSCSALAE